MENNDIRKHAAERGVRLWEIADALGMADATFSRKLRKEFTADQKRDVDKIIVRLAGEK